MSDGNFDFGAMLDAQFKGMDRDRIRYAKADQDAPDPSGADEAADEGSALDASIRQAYEQNMPIDGKVEKEIKGGYEVTVKGQRGFCPYSQIDIVRRQLSPGEENPYVGASFTFRITEYGSDDRGVNLVVSRRAQQEAELETAKEYLRDTLEEGQTVNGSVAKVVDFGCFVELGGLQGLVPVREISWDKVDDPHRFVKEGDLVTVKVMSVDWTRDRISLSIRQCQAKPLKPRTPEEIARDAEAEDVKAWMEDHADTSSFSNIGGAFAGLKL